MTCAARSPPPAMVDADPPDAPKPSRPADTVSVLTYRTGIQDANIAGNVHGGGIMKLCDDAAAIAAARHLGGRGVTAAGGRLKFPPPGHVRGPVTPRAAREGAGGRSLGG